MGKLPICKKLLANLQKIASFVVLNYEFVASLESFQNLSRESIRIAVFRFLKKENKNLFMQALAQYFIV